MAFVLALIGSLVPCLLWLWFFYSRDKHDPEPKPLIARLFLIGAFPVAIVAGILNTIVLLLITGGNVSGTTGAAAFTLLAIFVAPVTEELSKYAGATVGAGRHPAFNEPLDGIIYGTTVGLGFAAAETTDYLTGAIMGVGPLGTPIGFCEAGFECFTAVALLRGLGSAVLHATASGIACYGMSRRKEGASAATAFGWIALAMLMHALWNFLSFLTLVIPVVIYARLVRQQLARSPFIANAVLPPRYYDPRVYGPPPQVGVPHGYGLRHLPPHPPTAPPPPGQYPPPHAPPGGPHG